LPYLLEDWGAERHTELTVQRGVHNRNKTVHALLDIESEEESIGSGDWGAADRKGWDKVPAQHICVQGKGCKKRSTSTHNKTETGRVGEPYLHKTRGGQCKTKGEGKGAEGTPKKITLKTQRENQRERRERDGRPNTRKNAPGSWNLKSVL